MSCLLFEFTHAIIHQKDTSFQSQTLKRAALCVKHKAAMSVACATKLENQQALLSDQNFKLKKNRIQKKLLNGYSKIHELKLVTIGLASPEKIQSWAEKELPNGKIFGEVTNANTYHYRTFKPSKGGLFCERIFGPLKDFECACGKRKKPTAIESKKILEHEQTSRNFCPNCDVEYTWSILRRYQLGYIKLNAPVAHLWYFKTNPSFLSILFDMKRKDVESIIYCAQTITIENIWKYSEQNSSLSRSPTDLYLKWQKFFSIEEKTKVYQILFQNKKEKQRQAKEKYRKNFFTKNIFQKQTNWQNFETQKFLTSLANSESVMSLHSFEKYKNLPLSSFSTVQQKQIEILVNIYKQKQKKFISFAIQEIWKKFLQKSYQKSFIFNTSIEVFSDNLSVSDSKLTLHKHLQKIIQNFSIFFFFSSLVPGSFHTKKRTFGFQRFSSHKKAASLQKNVHINKTPEQLRVEQLLTENEKFLVNSTSATKKYKRLFSTNENSIFNDFVILKNINNVSVNSSFDSLVENQYSNIEINENLKTLNKKKLPKTKFWKPFFFLLEFGILFFQQKNKKIKNLLKLSKKDVLFLFNLLPFLKKFKFFQNTKLGNKDFKKIQIFLQNSIKKSEYQINSNFDNKIYSVENVQLEIQNLFFKRKSFISKPNMSLFSNFVNSVFRPILFESHKKDASPRKLALNDDMYATKSNFPQDKKQTSVISTQLDQSDFDTSNTNYSEKLNMASNEMILPKFSNQLQKKNFVVLKEKIEFLQAKQIEKKITFHEVSTISMHFEKILCFLKTYYEIDFCFIFYNSIFFELFPETTNRMKKLSDTEKNLLFQKSLNMKNWDIVIEKGIEIFIQKSQTYSLIEKVSFEYFTFLLYLFKSNVFSNFANSQLVFENWENKKENIELHIESSKAQNFLFIFLNYVSFVFISFSHKNKINKTRETLNSANKISSNIDYNSKENQISSTHKKTLAKKVYINNQQFTSKVKFYQRKKQIELNKFTEFFHLCSIVPSSQHNSVSNQKRKNKIQKINKTRENLIRKNQKKANFDNFADISRCATKTVSSLRSLRDAGSLSATLLEWQSSKLSNWKQHIYSLDDIVPTNKNVSSFQQKNRLGQQNQKVTISKASPQKSNTFLKNKILTIAYNHVWNNDTSWRYFVYYNSLFLYEFEDAPIFIYRSISKFSEKSKRSIKLKNMKKTNSTSKNINNSYLPFFDFDFSRCATKNFFVGAGILEKLFTEYTSVELRKMTIQHQILLPRIQQTLRFLKQTAKTKKDSLKIQKYFQKREHIIRRLKFLRKFSRRNSNPSFMILRNLPVLPPDLRPILKLQNQIAASDLNRLYQRIIYRNERFKKFAKDSATNQSFELKYAQRLLQEAVDNLIQNGKGSVKAETNSRGQPLKSLSEILKGKQGRFRQYLLGKRVDYSGRSVIVVGPELKLYECGIPKEIALELFLPFLIQYILKYKLAQTVVGAKNILKSDSTFTLQLLQKVMKNVPVLLNRAPTLHRLGFQAFLPKLIDGRAILLHPMVCPAFNADFDGDQMAVHIPLTVEARTEAWKFMLSINNFINSATGEPVLLPSQDMVLGCFFLTNDFLSKFVGIQFSNYLKKQNFVFKKQESSTQLNFYNFVLQNKSFLFFKTFNSVITAYQRKEIFIHTPVWMKVNGPVDFGNDSSKPVEIRLQPNGTWEKIQPKYTIIYDRQNNMLNKYIRTTVGRILMNLMIQECIHNSFL